MPSEPQAFGSRVDRTPADADELSRVASEDAAAGAAPLRLFARRLELRSLLGSGKCGETWRAYHHVLGRDVAVKIVSRSATRSPALADLRREAMALDKLHHRAFPRIYECDHAEDGSWYLVEEFIDGEPLSRTIQRGPMEPLAAVELVIELAEALHEAHTRGILHGDISFTNLMLERSLPPRPRIIDLSECRLLAAFHAACDQRYAPAPAERGDDGKNFGHPGFAAPELFLGGTKTERSDIYSLGAVLFMLLTGAQMPNAVVRELLSEEAGDGGERLREHMVEAVPALEDTFIAADFQDILAQDPALRVPTMAALLELLRAERDALHTLRSGDRDKRATSAPASAPRAARPSRHGGKDMSHGAGEKAASRTAWGRWAALVGGMMLAGVMLAGVLLAGALLGAEEERGADQEPAPTTARAVAPVAAAVVATAPVRSSPRREDVVAAVTSLAPRLRACPDAPRRLPLALEVGETVRLVELKYGQVVDSQPLDRCVRALVESLRFDGARPARHAITVDLAGR